MRGVGAAWGAITIVNALPTGVGCAAAIALPVDVEVDLQPRSGSGLLLVVPTGNDTPLVRRTLEHSLGLFAPGWEGEVHVTIRSTLPPARGLKSSSAVGVAIVRAVAAAAGRSVGPRMAARVSAQLGRQEGWSATGAFDDALAAAAGGIVVTRNGPDELLRADAVDPTWRVALWVPGTPHMPSPAWRDAFRSRSASARAAAELAMAGGYLGAMRANTELVEEVIGYPYRDLRGDLERHGALAAGVSGMGPTLAAIATEDHIQAVLGCLPTGNGETMLADFVHPAGAPPTEEP